MAGPNGDTKASFAGGGEGGDAQSTYERGNQLAQQGDLDGAEEAYRRADERGHPTAAACVGLFCEARGELPEAEAAYRRADERGDGFGAFRLGLLLAHNGDWDAANEAWSRAEDRGHEQPPFDPELLSRRLAAEHQIGADANLAARRSAFANPVLIGAVTVLALLIAVFLAYNANQGLPFVPTKELKVDIANGANLIPGNDVREGGFRIGVVSDTKPIELPNGQVGAQLILRLDQAHGNVPADSTVSIRPASVLGVKYVDLVRGISRQSIADGGTLPLGQTSVPVQFDDINKLFDARTRPAVQQNLAGFGDVLAARGSALNDTIASLPALFVHLRPVAAYLSDPSTQLSRLLGSLDSFMGAVAPVAATNARLFTGMASTFEAISRDPVALEQTIVQSPPTLDAGTGSLLAQRPFLVDLTTVGRDLTPASVDLRAALPDVNPALEAGSRVLGRTPSLNADLQRLMNALKDLARAPETNVAINALTGTVQTLNPMVRYLGPYQTVCDDWNYWWTYLSEHISEATSFGFAQRALLNFANNQQDNVGSAGASQPANGYAPAPNQANAEYYHAPVYGAAVDNAGNADCETGQRGYVQKLNHSDPLGRLLDTDPHTPGNQGATFAGLTRVPPGETFSRSPQTGPQTTYISANP